MNTIARVNLAERVRDVLTAKIARGDIAPGERLVEQTLAKEFGTSQTPIREALRLLEAVRLVETIPHRGTRVRTITDRELLESHATRGILEQGAARYAAPIFARHPERIRKLREHTEIMLTASRAGDLETAAKENRTFHTDIVTACGNRTLLDQWLALGIESRGLMSNRRVTLDTVAFTEQHWAIVDALAAGRGEEAGKLLLEHSLYFVQKHQSTPEDWAEDTIAGGQ